MNKKIRLFKELSSKELQSASFVLCSEESVRCKHLSFFRKIAEDNPGVLVAMPKEELRKGRRGWAKAQILASIEGVGGVVACLQKDLKRLAAGDFGSVKRIGDIFFQAVEIDQTTDPADQNFMEKARQLLPKSTCWWRPTACVFVRDKKVVMTSACFSHWQTNCKELSVRPTDISLVPGEKISFCDGIHSEKIGIARAARKGISLDGASLYATSCPCEECAKEIIEAGIKRAVFDKEYYDRDGLILLKKHGVEIAKIRNDKT